MDSIIEQIKDVLVERRKFYGDDEQLHVSVAFGEDEVCAYSWAGEGASAVTEGDQENDELVELLIRAKGHGVEMLLFSASAFPGGGVRIHGGF